MIAEQQVMPIGKVGKAHGVKGEVTLYVDNDVFDRMEADYLVLRIDGILVPFFIEEYRWRNDSTVLMKFCDVDSVQQARALTGCEVLFPRELADEESAADIHSVIGYELYDGETPVGTVTGIDASTINTLLEVQTPQGKEVLIPVSDELITAIDTECHRIVMSLPEGLLDL